MDSSLLELKAELARLQEKEAALSHMLSLERGQRVRAEQFVEVERMACLELKHRLGLIKEEDEGNGEDGEEDSEKSAGADVVFEDVRDVSH